MLAVPPVRVGGLEVEVLDAVEDLLHAHRLAAAAAPRLLLRLLRRLGRGERAREALQARLAQRDDLRLVHRVLEEHVERLGVAHVEGGVRAAAAPLPVGHVLPLVEELLLPRARLPVVATAARPATTAARAARPAGSALGVRLARLLLAEGAGAAARRGGPRAGLPARPADLLGARRAGGSLGVLEALRVAQRAQVDVELLVGA